MKVATNHAWRLFGVVVCGITLTAALAQEGGTRDQQKLDKRARQYLQASFPRTKLLMNHLRTEEPELHEALLEFAQRSMRERESLALDFARRNHPELHDLLIHLKGAKPKAYRMALIDLIFAERRLERVEGNEPDSYRDALEAWRVESEVRLRVARAQLAGEAEWGEPIRDLARTRVALERRRTERQIEQYQRKIDAAREALARDVDEVAEAQVKELWHRVGKGKR